MPLKCPEKKREYDRKYHEENREKRREYNRKYYEKNREKLIENKRKYYEENREKFIEYNRKYYEENREKLIEYNRKYNQKYREKNPQYAGTYKAVARTSLTIEELFNGLSREEVNAELAFDYRLAKLLSEKEGEPYEIDHYPVAICNGGHHRLYNIRIVPRWVNRQGGDHSADAFGMEDNLTDEDIERLDREALEFQP